MKKIIYLFKFLIMSFCFIWFFSTDAYATEITEISIGNIQMVSGQSIPNSNVTIFSSNVVKDDSETFWVRYDSKEKKLSDVYPNGAKVNDTPIQLCESLYFQITLLPESGKKFSSTLDIEYNGSKLSLTIPNTQPKSSYSVEPDGSKVVILISNSDIPPLYIKNIKISGITKPKVGKILNYDVVIEPSNDIRVDHETIWLRFDSNLGYFYDEYDDGKKINSEPLRPGEKLLLAIPLITRDGIKFTDTLDIECNNNKLPPIDESNPIGGGYFIEQENYFSRAYIFINPDELLKYSVTFNANNGIFNEDKTEIIVSDWEDSKLSSIEKPMRDGYKFLGFFNEKNGGISIESYIEENSIDKEDLIFYAQWEKEEIKTENTTTNNNSNTSENNNNNRLKNEYRSNITPSTQSTIILILVSIPFNNSNDLNKKP